ncbi:MAG: hypothetical protein IPK25_05430 [Saprospiraceae bacterium]|nr:hypothetical protein [Saprospiraceae bacterium]
MDNPDLWQRCKKGDRDAFKLLYQLHIDDLVAYGRKICSDQEILEDGIICFNLHGGGRCTQT